MSDMEQSDVTNDAAPAEPTAAEPTAEELQAEIDELKAAIEAQQGADPNPQVNRPTPVVSRTPSSEAATQQPEAAPVVDAAPLSLEDAVRALLIFVKGRRIVGDSDLDAALADVEAALPAQDTAA